MTNLRLFTPRQLLLEVIKDVKITQEQGILIYPPMWVDIEEDSKEICSVCYAGALALQKKSIYSDFYDSLMTLDHSKSNAVVYLAINELRSGFFYNFKHILKLDVSEENIQFLVNLGKDLYLPSDGGFDDFAEVDRVLKYFEIVASYLDDTITIEEQIKSKTEVQIPNLVC